LTERHEIGEGAFVEPATPHHEFITKITQMRYRAAKRCQAEPKEDSEHFAERRALRWNGFVGGHVHR
jgi:hypothetical protein